MSAKQKIGATKFTNILAQWDKGSIPVRRKILRDFIAQHQNKTGTEIEEEMAHSASLFLTRITSWLRLTYMLGTCLPEQLEALKIFLNASSSNKFLAEFLEVGGLYTLLEIINLKQSTEDSKMFALSILQSISNVGRNFKEVICECYGVRSIAECLAKSRSEKTQTEAKYLLENLAKGNPRYQNQVYKGLIALLPCSSPKAQELAAQTIRIVQPVVGDANMSIVEPLIGLLKSLHIEVQYEAIELITMLMDYNIRDVILKNLVTVLKPIKKIEKMEPINNNDENINQAGYIQQAAAAKAIGILAKLSNQISEQLLSFQVVHNLLFTIGNEEYADSQRQASKALEYFVRHHPIVADHVREACGDVLFELFLTDPDGLYAKMTPIQADVCRSNKIYIPYRSSA